MKFIKKQTSPAAFEAWKLANNPKNWNDLKNAPADPESGVVYFSKSDLRKILVAEQGFLCCYCQQQIDFSEKTSLEHFFPKDGADKILGKTLMFDYQNLLAVCDGGQFDKGKVVPRQTFCDRHKLEKTIPLSPIFENIESRFSFIQTAVDKIEIISSAADDSEVEKTIKILNLNAEILQKRRGSMIAGLIFQDQEMTKLISSDDAKKLLNFFEKEIASRQPEDKFPVFCTVQIHFLKLIAGEK